MPTAAQGELDHAEATAEGFAPVAVAAQPGQHTHAGFTAALRYHCANPAALRGLALPLPTLFPGLHEVIVNTATSTGQGRSVVTADSLRVPLAP